MFEIGDRVITETGDELNGLLGTVKGLSSWQEAAHVLLDEDAEMDSEFTLFFFNDELRKVDA